MALKQEASSRSRLNATCVQCQMVMEFIHLGWRPVGHHDPNITSHSRLQIQTNHIS
jgi:hypothetical protein